MLIWWFERVLAELNFELVDGRCSEDRSQASAQTEDGSARCAGCRRSGQ